MRHDLLHHHLSSIQRWLCCWRMVGKQMNRFTDIDPDAGDKAWDRIKERDLDEWVERRRRLDKIAAEDCKRLYEALTGKPSNLRGKQ
jgi:hypothetical protein